MDDVITASQQWRCWETQQKIVDQTTTEANETKEVNLIAVALLKATARKGETAHKAFNLLSTVKGTHNHQIDNWNNHHWLRRHMSKLVGPSKLSFVVVENKWELSSKSNDLRKKKKEETNCFKAKCPSSFFEDKLPAGLMKHLLPLEDACMHFLMNVWFFTMLHAFQRKIQECHSVESVKECRDIEEGHKSWLSTLAIDHKEAEH